METTQKKLSPDAVNQHEEWFSSFISKINEAIISDKAKLEKGDASKETMNFYLSLIDGDTVKAMSMSRRSSSNVIIKEMVVKYLTMLNDAGTSLTKLAIDTSPNKVLVWAEIKENDEHAEMELISIESKLNADFGNLTDIYLDSIIVEDCDNLKIPTHYKELAFITE